ncbi:hypothetical protein B5F39_11160 [Cloacibacillus sp. An23]|nr:hypothetical protein B5F39_11160 [Cloacibacillus sp. An23]
MSVKEIFAEHKWLWIVAALAVFAAGALCAVWLNARNAADIRAPAGEIAATEEASKKITETIAEAQKQKDRLPEVIRNAKEKAVRDVGADSDSDIARRWNGLLGRYREHKTPAGGLRTD